MSLDIPQTPADDANTQSDKSLGPVVARLERPRLEESVTLAIVADAHLAVSETGTWKVLHRTDERLETALATATGRTGGSGADAVIFAGDQTHDGLAKEFERFAEFVDDLDRPWAAIPGNHDVQKEFDAHNGLTQSVVNRRFRGDATSTESESSYPRVLTVGDLRILCVNTAAPPDRDLRMTWGGAVGTSQRERLRERLVADPQRPTLVVAHHNLKALPEHEAVAPWDRFPMEDASAVRDILATADVPLAITAHHHVPTVRTHGNLTEIMAPAVCSFPQAMVALHIDSNGTTVQFFPLADMSGVSEAYWHAATGKPLGQGILDMTTDRLTEF